MHNTYVSFIFIITVSIILLVHTSSLLTYKNIIQKNYKTALDLDSNIDQIQLLLEIVNNETNSNDLSEKLSYLASDNIDINITDESSKIDLNFVDFTIFKDYPFNEMLKDNFTWSDLNEVRVKNGFVNNIDIYKSYFNDSLPFNEIFTFYSIPNINNCSDLILSKLFLEYSNNELLANNLKIVVDSFRRDFLAIDDSILKRISTNFGEPYLYDIFTTIPSWNINTVNQKLLEYILSKYGIDKNNIINFRKNNTITEKELIYLIPGYNSINGLSSYLGVKTTFWRVIIDNKIDGLETHIILRWDLFDKQFKVVSILRKLS